MVKETEKSGKKKANISGVVNIIDEHGMYTKLFHWKSRIKKPKTKGKNVLVLHFCQVLLLVFI